MPSGMGFLVEQEAKTLIIKTKIIYPEYFRPGIVAKSPKCVALCVAGLAADSPAEAGREFPHRGSGGSAGDEGPPKKSLSKKLSGLPFINLSRNY